MATNKYPYVRNLGGAPGPLRMLLPVDAGSSYAIKRGELCKVGKNTSGRPGPVTASTDNTGLVIADQEQKSDDSARFLPFIVPRPDDVFEFSAYAARAFVLGDPLAISDSQTLAYTAAGTNAIARIADDSNCPLPEEKSVTRRSISKALVTIAEAASYFAQLSGNS